MEKPEDTQSKPEKLKYEYLDHHATSTDIPRLDRKWLLRQSKEDLVDIIFLLAQRIPRSTDPLDPSTPLPPSVAEALDLKKDADTRSCIRVPATPPRDRDHTEEKTWRIVLVCHNPDCMPLDLEIYDDAFIGRTAGGITPDVDLADYGAVESGVSRQHALFRPTPTRLLLVDLGSTNHTYCNGEELEVGTAQELHDQDTIGFGHLFFSVLIVRQP